MSSEWKNNVLNADTWLRLVYLVVFWLILWLIGWALGLIVLIQFVIVLITGERNNQLSAFGARFGQYLRDVVSFMCFSTDEKPFPFSDFPDESGSSE